MFIDNGRLEKVRTFYSTEASRVLSVDEQQRLYALQKQGDELRDYLNSVDALLRSNNVKAALEVLKPQCLVDLQNVDLPEQPASAQASSTKSQSKRKQIQLKSSTNQRSTN